MAPADIPVLRRALVLLRHYLKVPFARLKALPFREGIEGKGRFVIDPLHTLYLEGSPEEMGYQHGVLLRRQIQVLYRSYLDTFIELTMGRAPALQLAEVIAEFIDRDTLLEMRALARGAGVGYEEVLIAQTFLDSYKTFFCSAVLLSREATGGETLFGRNLDFHPLGIVHKMSIVCHLSRHDCKRILSINFPGLLGVLSAINEDGLCCAVLEVYNRQDRVEGLPYALLYRTALERCSSVPELESFLRESPRTCAVNLAVADAQGNARVFEITHDSITSRKPQRGVLFATNHFASDAIESAQCPRMQKLLRYAQRHSAQYTEEDIWQMLSDVAYRGLTIQSMLLRPESRRLELRLGHHPATRTSPVPLNLPL